MPHAEIKTKQAVLTLIQLHAELAGKFLENRNASWTNLVRERKGPSFVAMHHEDLPNGRYRKN